MNEKAEQLKTEILEKVREYSQVAHAPGPFVPFKTKVRYAGRVFDDQEVTALDNVTAEGMGATPHLAYAS